MSYLYINENGSTVSMEAGYFIVKTQDDQIKKIPKETLEAIGLFGNVSLTTPCVKECLNRKIPICYFSSSGYYFGKLESTRNWNIFRLKQQIHMSENPEFTLGFSKKIIGAKIQNQITILKRYNRSVKAVIDNEIIRMKNSSQKLKICQSIEQVLGHEGNASRSYFQAIAKMIEPEFAFDGRNRKPPQDPFNAMISFGYTILMNEIYGELENRGLTPYGGFMHQDRERHPTLASDLLEEWRAVIVDSTVLSMIQGHEVSADDFEKEENGGIILKKRARQQFLKNLEAKMHGEMSYLSYVSERTSFRKAIWLQVGELVKAVEKGDYQLYEPIRVR
ncbi:CRISPR-associated endonuclease Cas1 [[Clostridium] polysaccharolyticum]|uniref:CRISPR-associated endonuclease Cas1 n=1 Tax=[Clostridium] polysaccharolyticum TaxID=29364 RepID=A0A1I0AV99_9FIRM|nr:CRISPR-associated endonuclease Cas1 [[Clostridium] polysaccharolyticum]SES98376.1 CRISP-associated protein Cas1 [[Clostridium] polysaccharolyticum]